MNSFTIMITITIAITITIPITITIKCSGLQESTQAHSKGQESKLKHNAFWIVGMVMMVIQQEGGCPPSGCTPLRAALRGWGAPLGLGDDIGVVTPHEMALGNLRLLLLQHCV